MHNKCVMYLSTFVTQTNTKVCIIFVRNDYYSIKNSKLEFSWKTLEHIISSLSQSIMQAFSFNLKMLACKNLKDKKYLKKILKHRAMT